MGEYRSEGASRRRMVNASGDHPLATAPKTACRRAAWPNDVGGMMAAASRQKKTRQLAGFLEALDDQQRYGKALSVFA
ncbi:MAG: hypothetical protein M3Y93_04565 [Pseudomonadota bacterium]|nr:hypothetical protein [Pseudomonadota bacterium]